MISGTFNSVDHALIDGFAVATPAYRVFISHPERQHSHELASALAQQGRLGAYVHGAPLPVGAQSAIPTSLRRRLGFCRLWRYVLKPLFPQRVVLESYYRMIWAFDALMARRIRHAGCNVVVGYENSALATFQEAKRLGMVCILDNSGVHHATQDAALAYQESEAFHRRILARKDKELALADIILVCSSFARDSFIAAGISPERLHIVQLGCDISSFSPASDPVAGVDAGAVRFLFVGRLSRLKGADLLAAVAHRLRAAHVPFTLEVVAPISEAERGLIHRFAEVARLHDKVPYGQLSGFHSRADCLVLPSRFDSFAFVVAEGLASGLPVIVSNAVGARDMVVDDENGWVIPVADEDALFERMSWCALNVTKLRSMSAAARATAEAWDWSKYHFQVLLTIDRLMADACCLPQRPSYEAKTRCSGDTLVSQEL